MRRAQLVSAVALGALVLTGAPGGATSGPSFDGPSPWGQMCGFESVADLTREDGWQTGELDAGPIVLMIGDATVTCSIHVNQPTYSGASVAVFSAHSVAGVATLDPTTLSYPTTAADDVYACTTVDYDGGAPTLYLDDPTDEWTTDHNARCALAISIDPGTGVAAPGGGGRAHRKARTTDTSGGGGDPQPFYPSGTIEITKDPTGPVTFNYIGFVPPVASWNCSAFGTSTSCTPPPAPSGYYNVCGALTVEATAFSPGSVNGTSSCASGPFASATSFGPTTTPTVGSAVANTDFPWTCTANPDGDVTVWRVRCTVGQP